MCNFFSVVSDGKGKIMYFDWKLRKKCFDGKLKYIPDSHTSIADYYGYKAEKEDTLNKYEYNPILKTFTVDQLNTIDDTKEVEKFCREFDFKKIVPQLTIPEKIIHPFNDIDVTAVSESDLILLKKWVSICDSVRDSVWDSVWVSVRASVRDSVWDLVRDSVWDSVWVSVRASVRDSVWDSVRASVKDPVWDLVRDSVWFSVGAYYSSMFNLQKWQNVKHKKGVNPFQSGIDLWMKGLVPSFDGKIWRLHGGKDAKILWEGKI